MQYAVIKTNSPQESFELVRELIENESVMYNSFLVPYVDALVMTRKEQCALYFSEKIILSLEWLTDDSFEQFIKGKAVSYEIKNVLTNDVFEDAVIEEYERFAIDLPFSFSKPYELRFASRNACALAEIADRILREYGGKVVSYSLFDIFFDVEKSELPSVLERISQAKSAING